MTQTFSLEFGNRSLTFETGRLAGLAHGAVLARYGDTVVLATVVSSGTPREGVDFLPLTVDFEEKMYAAGKIPGGFFKREGRPPETAILNARMTDRPLRPLFPKDYRNEIQIIVTVLSADQQNDPGMLGITAASAAVSISDVPFYGPVGAVTVGYIDGQFVLNPSLTELPNSRLDLAIAGTADAVMMVEAGALELPEDTMIEAIEFGHRAIKELVALQERMVAEVGKPKRTYPTVPADPELETQVRDFVGGRLHSAVFDPDKARRESNVDDLRAQTFAEFRTRDAEEKKVAKIFDAIEKESVRNGILDEGLRPDGRTLTEIRPITCEVGVLPRTHGSGLFTRGQTQILSVCTLGTSGEAQKIDGIGLEEKRRFIHHYNFPPFSTGETRRMVGPSRRDIGHGHLVERSLLSVIPDDEEFPYTIRLVAEALSSNGSTSMGSVCAGTMALMDAGVPIRAPLAGVAMGLMTRDDGTYRILTDIQGVEDFLGDMDFKVAGTAEGICGLQMDIKVRGLTPQIMREAMAQAREGRLFILNKMLAVIGSSHDQLSPYAPRITKITINPDRIRDVIGPGGKMIRRIVEETKCTVDVEDDGTISIGSINPENAQKAIDIIRGLTREVEVGTVYTGKVTRLMGFGAFVEILPGKEGLVHISELSDHRVERVEDEVNVGDEITVLVSEIDHLGRVNLSRRRVLNPDAGPVQREDGGDRPRPGFAPRGGGGFSGGGQRGGPPRGNFGGPPRGNFGGPRPPQRDGGGFVPRSNPPAPPTRGPGDSSGRPGSGND